MLSARPALRHVRFILPNAPVQPVTLNMGMSMPSWFDITSLEDISEGEDEKGLLKSSGEIKKLVQAEIEKEGIPAERIVVGGFSQVSRQRGRHWLQRPHLATSARVQQRRQYTSERSVGRDLSEGNLSQAAVAATQASPATLQSQILGVGVDILHRPRLSRLLERQQRRSGGDYDAALDHFTRRMLSPPEHADLQRLRQSDNADPSQIQSWLAVRCVGSGVRARG